MLCQQRRALGTTGANLLAERFLSLRTPRRDRCAETASSAPISALRIIAVSFAPPRWTVGMCGQRNQRKDEGSGGDVEGHPCAGRSRSTAAGVAPYLEQMKLGRAAELMFAYASLYI
jgi:hypothetical protein